jgi:hypothetical protein
MMLDKGRHLACGGICLYAYVLTRVIFWLLETICRAPGVADKWRTLLADYDSPFVPAVASLRRTVNFPEGFRHRLWVMYKKRNLGIKVHSCGISKANKVVLCSLFDIVASCDHNK